MVTFFLREMSFLRELNSRIVTLLSRFSLNWQHNRWICCCKFSFFWFDLQLNVYDTHYDNLDFFYFYVDPLSITFL